MNLLLIRTSALGDVVHCLPVLTALRRHLPEARIGWVVDETFAPLLTGHPDLDLVLPVALRRWRRQLRRAATLRELFAFLGRLRGFRADVALDLMGNHKAGTLARLSGAPRRIGLERRARRERSSAVWINEPLPAAGEHAVERALALVTPLGVPPEAADFAGAKLPGEPLPGGDDTPFALLHPGAGWGNKVYPPERWAAVARGVRERAGVETRVALSPSPRERELAERIVTLASGAAAAVEAGALPALVGLSRRASLVLGGDTGPVHLAHAVGTPVVCVMGPTDPARHGPYGAPAAALAHPLPCSYCYRRFASTKACLLEIAPDEVVETAVYMLLDSTHRT